MNTVLKRLRKPAALMMVLALTLVLSTAVFAADYDATVIFYDDTTSTSLGTADVDLSSPLVKSYLPTGYTDPLSGEPSVYDAIIEAADELNYDYVGVGWDADPDYGDPGGYIDSITVNSTSYPTTNTYIHDEETGLNVSDGYGWVCTVTPYGESSYQPNQYLTLEALEDEMDIEFHYQHYHYEWYDE